MLGHSLDHQVRVSQIAQLGRRPDQLQRALDLGRIEPAARRGVGEGLLEAST
jgi:hypothetical protein